MDKNRKILTEFHPVIEKETVFRLLNCYPDSPAYEDMDEAYGEILEEMEGLCHPGGVLAFGTVPAKYTDEKREQEAVYVLATVGNLMSEYSTRAFAEGEYVKGMLADAMADAALFSLEGDIQRELREACSVRKKGVKRRLEAPHDIPMEIQMEALRQTDGERLLGLGISDGYMFRPVKTSCHIYLLTDEADVFRVQHNCRKCPNKTCMMRHVEPLTIRVIREDGGRELTFSMTEGTLLEALNRELRGIPSPCGGRGSCGKCRVQVIEGELPPGKEDRRVFSENELAQGWRLACQAVPDENLTIRVGWNTETEMEVLDKFSQDEPSGEREEQCCGRSGGGRSGREEGLGFAVDIGTTTLAIQMISLGDGTCLQTDTGLNPQRAYGADVISRIKVATEGKGEILRRLILDALQEGMERLCRECGAAWEEVRKVAVAGNTTMIHLLMGYPCDGLGSVPFTPYEIGTIGILGKELFPKLPETAETVIYPGISAFVGADIVSGLCALHMAAEEPVSMLIDLGTNGEMALGNRDRLIVTSTAAGPAFEGGNITWGTGSIPGAVCSASIRDGRMEIRTIQDQPPAGICGTGVIEITAELVSQNLVDETGLLDERWFETGYPVAENPQGETICLYQKDIREIQLAKAAVRAGVETLLETYGIRAEDVNRVYIAGGFGYRLDYEKAIALGMLPQEFRGKIRAVGNSSLKGVAELLLSESCLREAKEMASRAQEIDLASNPVFQEAYMEAMLFPEE